MLNFQFFVKTDNRIDIDILHLIICSIFNCWFWFMNRMTICGGRLIVFP